MRIIVADKLKYNPYNYEDLIKAPTAATAAYTTALKDTADLQSKLDVIREAVEAEPDSNAAKIFNNYDKSIENLTNRLTDYGTSANTKASLMKMFRSYSKDIAPIERAIELRKNLVDEQRKALLSNNSLMFTGNFADTGLDTIMANPSITYRPISGYDLEKEAATLAAPLAGLLKNSPSMQLIKDGQYFEQLQHYGYTPQDIFKFMSNDSSIDNKTLEELGRIFDTVAGKFGVQDLSAEDQKKAFNYIYSGLFSSVGQDKYDLVNNRNYQSDAEKEALNMQRSRFNWERADREEATKGIDLGGGYRYRSRPYGVTEVVDPQGVSRFFNNKGEEITKDGVQGGGKNSQDDRNFTTDQQIKRDSFEWINIDSDGKATLKEFKDTDDFDPSKANPVLIDNLPSSIRSTIKTYLKEFSMSADPRDIIVYKDEEHGTYRVRSFGIKADGTRMTPEEIMALYAE